MICITIADESTYCSKLVKLSTQLNFMCPCDSCTCMCMCTIHIVRFLLDPTLTLANLTPLLERMRWVTVGWRMDIPAATVDTIRSSGGDDSQRRRRCWEVYLSDHPAPSWKQVANALYIPDYFDEQEFLKELEVVQKKYLRGEWAVVTNFSYMHHHTPLLVSINSW